MDYIFAHFHPYWEPGGIPIDQAVSFIGEKYNYLKSLYPGKKIVVGETGWPTAGEIRGGAVPSLENQKRFLNEFVTWAKNNMVDFYILKHLMKIGRSNTKEK